MTYVRYEKIIIYYFALFWRIWLRLETFSKYFPIIPNSLIFDSGLFDMPHFPGVAARARALKCCDITSLVSAQRRHYGPKPTLTHFNENSSVHLKVRKISNLKY